MLLGFFAPPLQTATATFESWVYGLFLIAIVPTYYMLVHAILHRGAVRFIEGFYPFACVVFFLWMWLIMGIPHPTWVIFLTIPIVEWICSSIRKNQRRSQKGAVEAEVTLEFDANKVDVTPGIDADKVDDSATAN